MPLLRVIGCSGGIMYQQVFSRIIKPANWLVAKSHSLRLPLKSAQHIIGIACTGHGASLAYVGRDGVLRSSVLDRWAGTKHILMFSANEAQPIRYPKTKVDKTIHRILSYGFGKFPETRVFEETIDPWLQWLLRDIGLRAADIDLVVTSD